MALSLFCRIIVDATGHKITKLMLHNKSCMVKSDQKYVEFSQLKSTLVSTNSFHVWKTCNSSGCHISTWFSEEL